jgi:hypothetical protein
MDELAMEYVLSVRDSTLTNEHMWQLLQEMHGRCGVEHTNTYLNRARDILKMIGIK